MKISTRITPRVNNVCYWIAVLIIPFFVSCSSSSRQPSNTGITVSINQQTGQYTIQTDQPAWTFKGNVGKTLTNVSSKNGQDEIGNYQETTFQWTSDNQYTGTIRWYKDSPIVLFTLATPNGADHIQAKFPDFNTFPKAMHHYSFKDDVFSPPAFNKLTQTSTPWLFFNDQDEAFVLSPASDFIVSKMSGDGEQSIASGLNSELQNLPKNFTHKSILVFGKGINSTWMSWGGTLMKIYGKNAPSNDADPVLKYYGYWTDNGADYYYNYDKSMGYSGTLLAVRQQYKKEGIPLGYMQLDSWWYEKSIYDPEGKPDAGHKNPKLPKGKWNRYGGLMKYRPDKFLFPNGMSAFHQKLDLPLVVHNRWIDPHSPYHNQYQITGYAAIDPKFWNDIAGYLKRSGIICYEQDWLNYIYNKTPEMASDLSVGNAFTDGMANATKNNGLDMQYCMAMPRFFMQGVKYDNLTTIRTSGDRFEPAKWKHFIYTSQLGYSLGIWPWCDVFKSHETGNMIVSVLSAGAVGTGDALGNEDKANILEACRTDGVIVKPDAALVPVDADYINEANGANKPMLAFTYTRHDDITTDYVFAFTPNNNTSKNVTFQPSTLGQNGYVAVYDPLTNSAKKISASDTFTDTINDTGYTYYIIAPVTPSGIAFLGDSGKITSTGKQRISEMSTMQNGMQIKVAFASGEQSVTLHGYYEKPVTADHGKLTLHPDKKMFDLVLSPTEQGGQTAVVKLVTK